MPLACCFSFRLLQLKLFFVKADDFMYISVVKIYVIPKWCLVTKIKLSLKYVSQKSRGPQILMNEFADRNWKLSSLKARSHMTIGMTTGWQTYANYLAAHWLTVYQWS